MLRMQTQLKNPEILAKACAALGLGSPVEGSERFYDRSNHQGLLVRLPGWHYPLVVKEGGEIHFDNYNGHWGAISELERLQQRYAAEEVLDAMGADWTVVETIQPNGELLLELERSAW